MTVNPRSTNHHRTPRSRRDALSRGLGITLRDLLDFDDKPPKDSEIIALQTMALEAIRHMTKPVLAVAVKQLDALASLKTR
jgi:hypothetical protein